MSFVFDPDSLTSLSLDDTLCGKNVTVDPKIMDGNFLLRPLRSDDYEYLPLLEQMKSVEKVTQEKFEGICKEYMDCPDTYFIIVLENLESKKIVGCATLVVELKFIHKLSKHGYIEDVVVDENVRGKGLGQILVSTLVKLGKSKGCYKISLDCNKDISDFFGRNGFEKDKFEMSQTLFVPSRRH